MLLCPLFVLCSLLVVNLLLMFLFVRYRQGQEGLTRGVVEKASFDQLNKLFEISATKQNH